MHGSGGVRSGTAALLVFWAALFLPAVHARGFWDPDEGRYGEVAREVWQGRGGLVPHLAGETYPEKPPLGFWAVAGFQMLAGRASAPASRLPSALAVLFTALLLLSLVARSRGREAGLLAGAVYLASFLVIQMGSWVGLDSLVTLFTVLAIWCHDRTLAGPDGEVGPGAGRRVLFLAGMYASLAAVVLTKGAPVVIPVLAIAGRSVLRRGVRGLAAPHLLWGVPLVVVLCGAWALPAAREAGWGYLRALTLGQAERRLVSSTSHQAPPWYYLVRFPLLFLPFAVLLPAMAVAVRRAWRDRGGDRERTGWYALWFVVPFVVFSLVSGKRERYILPLYPAAAALAGIALAGLRGDPLARNLLVRPLRSILAVLGLLGLALASSPLWSAGVLGGALSSVPGPQAAEVLGRLRGGWLLLAAGGASALLVALEGLIRRREEAPVVPVCAALGALLLTLSMTVLPALDRVKSYGPLARLGAGPGARVALLDLQPGPFCLALESDRVEVIEGDHARRRARIALEKTPGLVLFAVRAAADRIRDEVGDRAVVLGSRRVGRRHLVALAVKGR